MNDTDATSRDTSRHDATPYDPLRHTLTVHEVELQLSAAGVGRTSRTIQRLCENKVFDAARLAATMSGSSRLTRCQKSLPISEHTMICDCDVSRHFATRRDMTDPKTDLA